MATLHVRNIPDELYQQLQQEAAADKRSLGAQVVVLLQRAVHSLRRQRTQKEILSELRKNQMSLPAGAADSVALLREDRSR